MRIGIDARALIGQRTGVGKFLEGMLAALARQNHDHEFVLVTPRPFAFDPPNTRWKVRQFRGPWGTNGMPWLQLYGPWLLRRESVDVFWGPAFLIPLATDRPALVTVHDLVCVFYPETMEVGNYLALRMLLRPSLSRARHITADSETTAADLRRLMKVPAGKISVIYPGVAPQFRPLDPEESRRRAAATFGLDGPYLLTVSTLEPRKNLSTLLQAFGAMPASFRRRVPLVIVGPLGWKSATIRASAETLVQEGSVRMLGYVSEDVLPWLYAGATFLLFPSLYEGFGLPVVEAMASGLPVIASDIPVIREVAGDGAVFVPPMDAAAWSQVIHDLAADDARRGALRDVGLRHAQCFTYDESAQRLLAILERLAGGQSGPEGDSPRASASR